MGPALCIVDIVAETKYILMEFIHILECRLHLNAFRFSLEIHRVVDGFLLGIQVLDEP